MSIDLVVKMSLNELQRRDLIWKFCENNPDESKSAIFHHFKSMGFKKTSIYNTIQLFRDKKTVVRKKGSGKKCALQDSKVCEKLKADTVGRKAKSYRQLGRKYEADKNTIKKYLESMNIQIKKRKSKPATTEKQAKIIKSRLRLLSEKYFATSSTYICIMDDESYFTVEGNEWQPKHYFESEKRKASDEVKYICIFKKLSSPEKFCCG